MRKVKATATAGHVHTLRNALSTQWNGAALAAKDAKAKNTEAMVAAVDNLDLFGLSEATSRAGNAMALHWRRW